MSGGMELRPGRLDLVTLRRIADGAGPVTIAPGAWEKVAASALSLIHI